MSRMDCSRLADTAPELALGILPGDERAEAVAHLGECAHCQQLVGTYTVAADQLLLLSPPAEPPARFDERVLAALATATAAERSDLGGDPVPPPPAARRRIPGAVLAVAAGIAALLLALGVVAPSPTPSVAAAEMRRGNGVVVGEIFVQDGPPARVFMNLPGWDAPAGPYGGPPPDYSLLITRERGPALLVPVTMSDHSTWAATVDDVDADEIATAALLGPDGRVWCSGTF